MSKQTPKCSRTSAEPVLLETARLPCFATGRPAAATTIAVAVEILNVPEPSPPVPQVSTIGAETDACNGTIRRFSASTTPMISSAVGSRLAEPDSQSSKSASGIRSSSTASRRSVIVFRSSGFPSRLASTTCCWSLAT